MKKEITSIYLFIASLFSVLSLYIFFIWFAITHYHPVINPSLIISSKRYELHPEIEIPLYLLGFILVTTITPILFFIYKKFIERLTDPLQENTVRLFTMIQCILFLIAWFLSLHIGQYGSTKILFILHLYIFVLSLFICLIKPHKYQKIILFISNRMPTLNKIENNTESLLSKPPQKLVIPKKKPYLIDVLVFLGIIILTLHISAVVPNDYNYFLGPVNDVIHGKTLLINSPSQYGLIVIYMLAFVFKFIIPLTYTNFFWMQYAALILGYFSLYLIIKKWLGGQLIGILALSVIIDQNYFHQIGNILFLPQVGFLRFGWWIVLLASLLYIGKPRITKSFQIIIPPLIVALALFWGLDSGIYVFGAYAMYIMTKGIITGKNISDGIKKIVREFIILFLTFAAFFISISTVVFLHSGDHPMWSMFFADTLLYSQGFSMIPLPRLGPYLVIIAIYLIFWSFILFKSILHKATQESSLYKDIPILSYIVSYGILQFLYYIGRSHPNNLHHVFIPSILLLSWLFYKLEQKYMMLKIVFIVIIIGIVLKDFSRQWMLPNINLDKQSKEEKSTLDRLRTYKKQTNSITIISQKETWYLLKSGSSNSINSNNLAYFVLISQIESLGQQILDQKPKYIFIDHGNTSDQAIILKKYSIQSYHWEKNIGQLDVWKKNNL